MPRFEPGNPGRPKGIPNKATSEIRAAARRLLEDEAYREALKARLLAGTAQHIEVLLHYYAYGRPQHTLAVSEIPPFAILLRRPLADPAGPTPSGPTPPRHDAEPLS